MTKSSGMGDQLFIAGYDIGADINSIGSLSTPRETLPGTDITQFAMARLFGKRDGQAEFTSYLDMADDASYEALSSLPRTSVHLMYLRGATLGNPSIGLIGLEVNYDPTRADDGSLMFGTSVLSTGFGIDWCKQLTAGKVTHASATNGSSVDTTASASFGFQAYLQVFSVGSGTVEITVQDSANNADWTDLTSGAFTNATGRTAERIQSSSATATVRRYLRVITEGTFTDAVFAVSIAKNAALRAI